MCPEPGQSEEPNGHNVFAGASVERCLPCVVCTVYCLVMYIAVHKPPARAEGRTTRACSAYTRQHPLPQILKIKIEKI